MGWEQKEIKGYLVDVDTGERLEFQHNPNDIGDDKSTAYLGMRQRIAPPDTTTACTPWSTATGSI